MRPLSGIDIILSKFVLILCWGSPIESTSGGHLDAVTTITFLGGRLTHWIPCFLRSVRPQPKTVSTLRHLDSEPQKHERVSTQNAMFRAFGGSSVSSTSTWAVSLAPRVLYGAALSPIRIREHLENVLYPSRLFSTSTLTSQSILSRYLDYIRW